MPSTVQPGEVLVGKYRVERVLGQGGMGIVVAARHVHLGELFAIKMLLPEAMSNDVAVERFLREARSVAKLKGEHVARVHDVGSLDNGIPFMVMEHLDGQDLKNVVKNRGPLPVDEAALYAYQACEAVAEAHTLGIVHRDLKPANLFLIRRPNGTPCVKVLDFGISKELDPANNAASDLTRTGEFMGSPCYMSPEQMANVKETDMRSDIWALGVILYELVVGKVPFSARAVTELVAKVLTTSPTPPSEVRPDIPRAFDAVVLRCLEKRPDQRFQSVDELMYQLLPFVQGNSAGVPVAKPRAELHKYSVKATIPMTRGRMESQQTTLVRQPPPVAPSDVSPEQAAHEVTDQSGSSTQGVTGGAWGNTSRVSARKSQKALVLGGVAAALVVLVGLGIFLTMSHSDEPTKTTDVNATTQAALPLPSAAERPKEPVPEVTPVETHHASSSVDTAKPVTTAASKAGTTSAPVKTTPATSPIKSTKTTKKAPIADFND